MLALAGDTKPESDIASLCQRAESRYAGVDCGIMDQYAVTCCPKGHAMLLDCRNLQMEFLPVPGDVELLLMHSGIRHELADSGYNQRAAECARATEVLATKYPAVTALRDADLGMLGSCKHELGDILLRRSRHVITENERTLAAADALRSRDLATLGSLLQQSHESLRDDYEVSCAEVDQVVDTALATDGVLGARMIGGGFGGCILALVEACDAEKVLAKIRRRCSSIGRPLPWSTIARPADPAGEIPAP